MRTASRISGVHGRAAVVFEVADAQSLEFVVCRPAEWDWRSAGVAVIGALHDFEENLEISNSACHGTDHAEQGERSAGGRKVPGRRNASGRWFESADSAEVCGHADGSAAIAADASGGHPGCDSRGFSSAGSARSAIQVPRRVGASVEQVVGLPGHEQLRSVSHAEDRSRQRAQPLDQGRIMRGDEPGAKARAGFAFQARQRRSNS